MSRNEGSYPLRNDWTSGSGGTPSTSFAHGSSSHLAASPDASSLTDPKQKQARLALRVVVHLYRVGPFDEFGISRPESTQQGIAESLQVTQGAVSKVLKRLAAANVVEHQRSHVHEQNRRMRAYFLTARGIDLARRCHDRFPDADWPA